MQKIPLRQLELFAQQYQRFGTGRLPPLLVMRNALRFDAGEFGQRCLRKPPRLTRFREPLCDKSRRTDPHYSPFRKTKTGCEASDIYAAWNGSARNSALFGRADGSLPYYSFRFPQLSNSLSEVPRGALASFRTRYSEGHPTLEFFLRPDAALLRGARVRLERQWRLRMAGIAAC